MVRRVKPQRTAGCTAVVACLLLVVPTTMHAQTANYVLTFRSEWNQQDHPFPLGAHYSSLIGATHSPDVAFWQEGALASPGIESMAETGRIFPLFDEITAAGNLAQHVTGQGIGASGSSITAFEADPLRTQLTLVTMIAPSPDWFVGVGGLDLRDTKNWRDTIVVDLFGYDAGTDSGTGFTSRNADTQPAEPISLLGPPLGGLPRLGTFTIVLDSVDGLTGDFDLDGDYSTGDLDALAAAIQTQAHSPAFDLNGDGLVDLADRDSWLVEAGAAELPSQGAYLLGDANLDGVVDVTDFNVWNTHKFSDASGWSVGDFNVDGAVDVSDFNLWNENQFQSAAPVPEPSSLALVGLLLLGGTYRRGQRQDCAADIWPATRMQ